MPKGVKLPSLVGRVFECLTVLEKGPRDKHFNWQWLCQCSCGKPPFLVFQNALLTGKTLSCGCVRSERASKRFMKHGHSATSVAERSDGTSYFSDGNRQTLTFTGWMAMLQRCSNPNNVGYRRYGARGIKVCERWQKFENFLADMGERRPGLTIDRIDVDGNYEPGNCRWATMKEQARNKSNNVMLTHNGQTKCLDEWANDPSRPAGLSAKAFIGRIGEGWTIEEALLVPKHTKLHVWRKRCLSSPEK